MGGEYDVIVIGGGPTGENAAWYARDHGLDVALVERELLGGECSYWACMPSKALLRPGDALAAAQRVPGAAPAVTGSVDVAAALATRDAMASHWDDGGQADWIEGLGATLLRGHARLVGERAVEVTGEDGAADRLTARRAVVIATGSTTNLPPVEGLADIAVWDNRDVTTAEQIPSRLLVLGGGVVGVEMAQAFRRLGAEVAVVEHADRLLSNEEPFVGAELQAAFENEGIAVRAGVAAVRAERQGDGPVHLTLEDGSRLEADEILVATGRRPRTDGLGLETVGLEPGRPIATDDQLRATDVEGGWLYAIGDVNGRAPLTHHGKYQARIVGDHLAGRDVAARADHEAMTRVVFTDPQVAAVGPTLAAARAQGRDVETLANGIGDVAGGSLLGEDVAGTAHLVVDRGARTVVGATFTGPGVGELLHAATIAIVSGATLEQLWHAVPAFPTSARCGCACSKPIAASRRASRTTVAKRRGRGEMDDGSGRQGRSAPLSASRA